MKNYNKQEVKGIDSEGSPVLGIFNNAEFADSKTPVTFTIHGLPAHIRFTYTNSMNFRGDPGDNELEIGVPAPSGIKVFLCKDGLLSGSWDNLIEGRTGRNGEWHTVLYEEPRDWFGNPVAIATHIQMNLFDTEQKLGPISVYEGSFGDGASFISRVIEVKSDVYPLSTPSGRLNALSYGTIRSPYYFDIDRAVNAGLSLPGAEPLGDIAVFALQAVADVHSWFRQVSQNEYEGFEFQIFLGLPHGFGTSFSSPLPEWARMNTVFIQNDHFDVHSVIAHEFCHQISYKLGLIFGLGDSRGLGITGTIASLWGEMVPFHNAERLTTYDVALLEGWAEFIEGLFGRHVPLVDRWWDDDPPAPGSPAPNNLWDEHGIGAKIEGCVAHALFRIYNDCYIFHPAISLIQPHPIVSSEPIPILPGDNIAAPNPRLKEVR